MPLTTTSGRSQKKRKKEKDVEAHIKLKLDTNLLLVLTKQACCFDVLIVSFVRNDVLVSSFVQRKPQADYWPHHRVDIREYCLWVRYGGVDV